MEMIEAEMIRIAQQAPRSLESIVNREIDGIKEIMETAYPELRDRFVEDWLNSKKDLAEKKLLRLPNQHPIKIEATKEEIIEFLEDGWSLASELEVDEKCHGLMWTGPIRARDMVVCNHHPIGNKAKFLMKRRRGTDKYTYYCTRCGEVSQLDPQWADMAIEEGILEE